MLIQIKIGKECEKAKKHYESINYWTRSKIKTFVKFLLKICINLVSAGKFLCHINNERNIPGLLINKKCWAEGYIYH